MTLKEVGRLAGVSAITVSRVLSGSYHVRDETKRKVLDAVKALDYKPHIIAQSLRSARTRTIGVLIPDISNPYFMYLIRSLEKVMRSHGYSILLASSDNDPVRELEMLRVLEMRVDGIVLATCQAMLRDALKSILARDVKIVLVDRTAEDVQLPQVLEENENGAYELVKHLIALGHREIAMINGTAPISTATTRERGFHRALREYALQEDSVLVLHGQFDQETGHAFTAQLLKSAHDRPSAIFCGNNSIAVGALLAIRERGLSVPQDISLVSFGDLLLPELITPLVTAVVQDPDAVGRTAATLLLASLREEVDTQPEVVVLPTHIRIGESVWNYHTSSGRPNPAEGQSVRNQTATVSPAE